MTVFFNPSVTSCHLPYIFALQKHRGGVCESSTIPQGIDEGVKGHSPKDRFYTSPQPCPVASRDIALKSKQEQKAKTIQQKGINLLLCARMCDRGGVRKDGGVENAIISVCLYRTFNPLSLWALPLYRCATQGERFKIKTGYKCFEKRGLKKRRRICLRRLA